MEKWNMANIKIIGPIAAALLAGAIMAAPAFAASDFPGGGGGGGGRGGGGGAPAVSGGGGSGGGMRGVGPGGTAGGQFRGPSSTQFSGPRDHSRFAGHPGRGRRGGQPHFGGIGIFGFGAGPYAYDYGWGSPYDEPDCYLRRVRIHRHWVWRQYCD
jgi:hypothetical protein